MIKKITALMALFMTSVAPAFANLANGSYTPTAVNATPKVTNATKILAGVSLVLSIKICDLSYK